MRLNLFTFCLGLAPAARALIDFEEGVMYTVGVYENGTRVTFESANPGVILETRHAGGEIDDLEAPKPKRRGLPNKALAERAGFVACWGHALHHAATDQAVQDWKSFLIAAGSYTLCSSSFANSHVLFRRGDVMVYYCIDSKNYCGKPAPLLSSE